MSGEVVDQHPMVAWLDGVLTEVERVAQAAKSSRMSEYRLEPGGVWTRPEPFQPNEDVEPTSSPDVYGDIRIYDEGGHSNEQADHIALHDPRAVLARVEAERKLIALHRPASVGVIVGPGETVTVTKCDECTDEMSNEWVEHPCVTLRTLAEGHRYDAPGWQTEWVPEGVSADV